MSTIPVYPARAPLTLEHRAALHPQLAALEHGISEHAFANLYLFRDKYRYEVSNVDGAVVIHGVEEVSGAGRGARTHGQAVAPAVTEGGETAGRGGGAEAPAKIAFWIFPAGLPAPPRLAELCAKTAMVKCISQAERNTAERAAAHLGYRLVESRGDFDYLYARENMAHLRGRKYHKKRNLINNFTQHYRHQVRPLDASEIAAARGVLDRWRADHGEDGDYYAATEALEQMAPLGLCGYIAYAEGRAVALALGEGLARHRIHVIHFEKGVTEYTGVYQYINQMYATMLPRHYEYINREQDLGDEGLRQAKMTYRPDGFVRKYRLVPPAYAERFATIDDNEATA